MQPSEIRRHVTRTHNELCRVQLFVDTIGDFLSVFNSDNVKRRGNNHVKRWSVILLTQTVNIGEILLVDEEINLGAGFAHNLPVVENTTEPQLQAQSFRGGNRCVR